MTRITIRSRAAVAAAMAAAVWLAAGVGAHKESEERQALVDHLENTSAAFLASIEGLGEAQWTWKPAPDRWSVAEVAEHITLAEGTLQGMVTGQVLKTPAAQDMLEKTKGRDGMVLQMIPDRSTRVQAPDMLQPKGTWKDRASLTEAFKSAREATIRVAADDDVDLRAHAMDSPLGPLDAHQWLLFISAHSERHTKQIQEVKETAGFPAK